MNSYRTFQAGEAWPICAVLAAVLAGAKLGGFTGFVEISWWTIAGIWFLPVLLFAAAAIFVAFILVVAAIARAARS